MEDYWIAIRSGECVGEKAAASSRLRACAYGVPLGKAWSLAGGSPRPPAYTRLPEAVRPPAIVPSAWQPEDVS